jgi:hypothetical protein
MIFAGTKGMVFLSTDNGQTWTQTSFPLANCFLIKWFEDLCRKCFGYQSNGGVRYSTNYQT